jgi:para-nitrobenzyl esterase
LPKVITLLGGRRALAAVSERVQKTWLGFAAKNSVTAQWPQYTPEERTTLIINDEDRLENDPGSERHRAWSTYQNYA